MKTRKINVSITGCLGRMGQQLIKSAVKDKRFKINSLTENKKQMRNMWDIPMTKLSEKKYGKHPSQKPEEVIERLILGCTNKNEIIIDPFSGSGTIPYVAKFHKRRFIVIENNETYQKQSLLRINELGN